MRAGHATLVACLLMPVCLAAVAEPLINYRVEPPTVGILLSGRLDSNKSVRETVGRKTDTMTTDEKFDINTGGWIYHPALLSFEAGLKPEFTQRRVKYDPGDSQKSDGTFLGFNLDAIVLPYKPYTVDLHASQNRSEYKSALAGDQTSESSVYRAKLRLKESWLPTTITLESRDQTTESFYTTYDKTDLAKLESRHRTESSDTMLEAEFQDRLRGGGVTETGSQQTVLKARNRYQPGEDSNLNSSFSHSNNRAPGTKSAHTSLNGGLVIRHRKQLQSDYQLGLENRNENNYNSRSGRAMASLQHRLYENLTTILSGNLSKDESSSGQMDDSGAAINLAYNRAIPWGKLNASVGHTEQTRDWRRVLAEDRAIGEAHTITFAEPWAELAQFDIVPGSIEVWKSDRSLSYTEGFHYSLTPIGRNVRLDWIDPAFVFGSPSVAILVDYRHATDPSAKTRLTGDSFGAGVNLWSMLGLSYKWDRTRANLLSGTPGMGDTQNRLSQALSASLNLGWRAVKSTTRVGVVETQLAAEEWQGGARGAARRKTTSLSQMFRIGNWSVTTIEVDDTAISGDSSASSQSPNKTQRARQIFTFQPTRRMLISMGANYSGLEYKDTGDRAKSSGYDATMRWLVGPGSFTAMAFNKETQRLTDKTGSMGFEVDYQWRYGIWQPSVRYTLAVDDQLLLTTPMVSSKQTRSVLYFEMKSEFY